MIMPFFYWDKNNDVTIIPTIIFRKKTKEFYISFLKWHLGFEYRQID
jgi:hypothetical protein